MGEAVIDILLSTYNGERFIEEQIDSLFAQTFRDWRLIARDDGSDDSTVRILERYCAKNPGKIVIIKDGGVRVGAVKSFARLLNWSYAGYAMFADQDDVWLPDKIELTLNTMRVAEAGYKRPVLVHTDMKVADERLNIISESFWRRQHLNPELCGLSNLLVLNNVTGCTVMINDELKRLALPIPADAVFHDWWLALVASAFGTIEPVGAPTLLYRQHGRNETGSPGYSLGYFLSRLGRLGLMRAYAGQARAFFLRYGDRLEEKDRRAVEEFSEIFHKGRLERLASIRRNGFRGYGVLRNIGIFALLMALDEKKAGGAQA